jgi:hypothetical protein
MYRSAAGIQTPPRDLLNYSEAASRFGLNTGVVAGLVAQGVLGASAGYPNGRFKLVPAGEIQRFLDEYVGVKALARHLDVTADWLRSHLKKSGTPMLTVRLSAGRRALFLLKEVASKVRILPPPGTS